MTTVKAKRLTRGQIKAPADHLEPPEWFNPEQKADWAFAVENAPPGLLANIDRGVLGVYVVALDQHRWKVMKGEASSVEAHKAAALMLKAASELGFSPAARVRVQAATVPESSGWEEVAA